MERAIFQNKLERPEADKICSKYQNSAKELEKKQAVLLQDFKWTTNLHSAFIPVK